jgi:hypothetical protein
MWPFDVRPEAGPYSETAFLIISTTRVCRLQEAKGTTIGLCDQVPVNCSGFVTTIGLRDKVPVILNRDQLPVKSVMKYPWIISDFHRRFPLSKN